MSDAAILPGSQRENMAKQKYFHKVDGFPHETGLLHIEFLKDLAMPYANRLIKNYLHMKDLNVKMVMG